LGEELVIPEVIDGKPVKSIGGKSFYFSEGIERGIIPNSVTEIGESAFSSCYNLKNMTIPDSVTKIGSSAFSFCSKLENIKIPDSVISIGNGAFNLCTNLESIEIPDSVTSIGSSAFCSCKNLKTATYKGKIYNYEIVDLPQEFYEAINTNNNADVIITQDDSNANKEQLPKVEQSNNMNFSVNIEELKQLKELLDMDVITHEDFNAKKKQLLGV
jgi:hypothetical protein